MPKKQSRALQDELRNRLDAKRVYGPVRVVPAVSKAGGLDVQLGLKLELKVLFSLEDFESLLDSHKTPRSFLSAVLQNGRLYRMAEVVEH